MHCLLISHTTESDGNLIQSVYLLYLIPTVLNMSFCTANFAAEMQTESVQVLVIQIKLFPKWWGTDYCSTFVQGFAYIPTSVSCHCSEYQFKIDCNSFAETSWQLQWRHWMNNLSCSLSALWKCTFSAAF